jgi:hypothetical protein
MYVLRFNLDIEYGSHDSALHDLPAVCPDSYFPLTSHISFS